jgi:ADP-ribose pyrophosphatase YjhB (NUDIX family)/ketosteroid isomerase-like protein
VDHFDLVRRWFAALNAGDREALAALYHDDCVNEQGAETRHGRDGQRRWFDEIFAARAGGFAGGVRRKVRSIGRIETGVIHAEWTSRERDVETGEVGEQAGYDEFTIEAGQIRRQRGVPRAVPGPLEEGVRPAGRVRAPRQYPSSPIVGVGAVIVQDDRVVLVKRRYEPLAGQWSLPGGRLELGETLEAGLSREMLEETGLEIEVGPVIEVFDRILLDEERHVRFHYVLIDYLCRPLGGTVQAGSDVAEAVFVAPGDLAGYHLTAKATAVIERGLAMARRHARGIVGEPPSGSHRVGEPPG